MLEAAARLDCPLSTHSVVECVPQPDMMLCLIPLNASTVNS
jgi:hypothetical protein